MDQRNFNLTSWKEELLGEDGDFSSFHALSMCKGVGFGNNLHIITQEDLRIVRERVEPKKS